MNSNDNNGNNNDGNPNDNNGNNADSNNSDTTTTTSESSSESSTNLKIILGIVIPVFTIIISNILFYLFSCCNCRPFEEE